MRPGAGQEKSYRNRAKSLNMVEPELFNFTFELLCFPPVLDQPLQTHPAAREGENRIKELMGHNTDRAITG